MNLTILKNKKILSIIGIIALLFLGIFIYANKNEQRIGDGSVLGASITTINATDTLKDSRTVINDNFTALNSELIIASTDIDRLQGSSTYWDSTYYTVNAGVSNWNTAYSWGNHSGIYDFLGQATSTLTSHTNTYNHSNYNTAYTNASTSPYSLFQIKGDYITLTSLTGDSPITYNNSTGHIGFDGSTYLTQALATSTYTTQASSTATYLSISSWNASTTKTNLRVGTADALTSNPSDCSANQFANAIAANGNLTCSALTDADIPDDITASNYVRKSTWTDLNSYPSACGAGQYVTQVGDTLTCSAPSSLGYLTAVGSDSTWTQHNSYPSGCTAGQFVTAIGDTLTCDTPAGSSLTGTQGQIAYFSGTNTAVGTSTIYIGVNGYVGIGTTVPTTILEVTGTSTFANLSFSGLLNQVSTTIVALFQKAKFALSLIIPIDKYLDTQGQIAIDTTTGQLRSHTGTATTTYPAFQFPSFTYATSTAWTGTTTIPLGTAYQAETWSGVQCYTDTGTLNVSFYDGTNRMNLFNASTTIGTVTLSTNNTFTAAETRKVDIGTPASSPTKISCTVRKTINAD